MILRRAKRPGLRFWKLSRLTASTTAAFTWPSTTASRASSTSSDRVIWAKKLSAFCPQPSQRRSRNSRQCSRLRRGSANVLPWKSDHEVAELSRLVTRTALRCRCWLTAIMSGLISGYLSRGQAGGHHQQAHSECAHEVYLGCGFVGAIRELPKTPVRGTVELGCWAIC